MGPGSTALIGAAQSFSGMALTDKPITRVATSKKGALTTVATLAIQLC